MELLLIRYGYLLLFIGIMFEGEAFLLAGAFLASHGTFSLPTVIAVAVAANTVADQLYYLAARLRGRAWLEKRFGGHPRYPRLVELMTRHGRWLLVASRYAFGFRILIPAACGAFGMPVLVFTLLNLLAGAVWAVPTALLGYYAGQAAQSLLAQAQRYQVWIAVGAVVAAATVAAARKVRRAPFVRDLGWADLHALVPFVMGLMGLVNLLSAILPRSHASLRLVGSWLPLEVMQGSRLVMLFSGLALIQVTRNLARRKELAWWVAVFALAVSFLSHLGRAFDFHHSLVAGLLLAYLVVFRKRFYSRSDPASLRTGLVMIPVLGLVVLAYGAVGLDHLRPQYAWEPGTTALGEAFRSGILILDPSLEPVTRQAARFLGSLQVAGWVARLYVLVLLLRPVLLRDRQEAPAQVVEELFRAHGQHSLAAFAVQPDKHHLLVAGGRGLVAYAVQGAVAFSCGDPLVPDEAFKTALTDFLDHCRRHGWTPCFYEAAEEWLPVYHGLGLRSLKMAEEAVIDLAGFSLAGGKRAALRSMVHKVERMGLRVRRYERAAGPDPGVDEQLEEISEEWLEEKRLGELGFTLGRFSLEALDGVPVFLCESEARIEAFCTWLPYRDGRAAVVDLMRKKRDAVSGTMDLLIAESLASLRAAGLAEASLANAPLANVGEPRGQLEKGVALLFERLNGIYGYKNLFQFKKKFAPRWEGRYLVYPRGADLPGVALAMTRVHGSGGLLEVLFRR